MTMDKNWIMNERETGAESEMLGIMGSPLQKEMMSFQGVEVDIIAEEAVGGDEESSMIMWKEPITSATEYRICVVLSQFQLGLEMDN